MATADMPLAGYDVIIVEDGWQIAESMQQTLMDAGATVVGVAGTLRRAEKLAAAGGFNAAVVDLNLGDQRANGLAAQLAAAGVKVVILTAYALPAELVGKVHGYLTKPAKPQDIVAALLRT